MISQQTNFDRVKSNQKQQSKISWKRNEARNMADAIFDFLKDQSIDLPSSKIEYKNQRDQIFTSCHKIYEERNDLDKVTGKRVIYCIDDAAANFFDQLINLYYKLRSTNKAIYAMFENQGITTPMLMMAWYTKHRLDPVWLMRKSQLIRRLYMQYFEIATVQAENGKEVKLTDHLQPYHLTLTVPHKGGTFAGEEFYAKQLNSFFLMMRRSKKWKDNVHAGEYGIEVKPSYTGNGLHIHIHSLVFLKENSSEHLFNSFLKRRWQELTGATELHFEKLYVYKPEFEDGCISEPWFETVDGRKLRKTKLVADANGKLVQVQAFKYKKYITPGSNITDYMKGVMECIKYHFKSDAITDENGNYDVPLMANILNNSMGLRFYSKFGKFYNEPLLNFDTLKTTEPEPEEPVQLVEDFEKAENISGKAQTAINNLINPFTHELALPGTYELAVAVPEHLKYTGKKGVPPYTLMNYDAQHFIPILDTNATLPDVIKLMVNNKLHTVLGVKPQRKRNRKHEGYYENDWFLGVGNLVFEF